MNTAEETIQEPEEMEYLPIKINGAPLGLEVVASTISDTAATVLGITCLGRNLDFGSYQVALYYEKEQGVIVFNVMNTDLVEVSSGIISSINASLTFDEILYQLTEEIQFKVLELVAKDTIKLLKQVNSNTCIREEIERNGTRVEYGISYSDNRNKIMVLFIDKGDIRCKLYEKGVHKGMVDLGKVSSEHMDNWLSEKI